MRYIVTYTTDSTWSTVDTFLVETDVCPADMETGDLIAMFEGYVEDSEIATNLAFYRDQWFCMDIDKYEPDVIIKTKKEK